MMKHLPRPAALVTTGLLALLGAALAGLPLWAGYEAEKSYRALLEQLSRAGGMSLGEQRYDRGWLHSEARTELRLPGLPGALVAQHRISHGPLAFDRLLAGELDLAPIQARIASELRLTTSGQTAAPLPPLIMETTIPVRGGGVMLLALPPFQLGAPDGGRLEWHGLRGELRFDRDWQHLLLDLNAAGARLSAGGQRADKTIEFQDLRLRADLREGAAGYPLGETVLTLARFALGPLAAEGLRLASQTRAAGEHVTLALAHRLEAVHAGGERLGPGELDLELRRLDAAALRKFEQALQELRRKRLPAEQANLIGAGKVLELIATLARQAPELEVTTLRLQTAGGELSGRARFVLDGRSLDLGANPMLLLTALSGELELTLPPGMIAPLLAPLILKDIEASRAAGRLTAEEAARLTPAVLAQVTDQALPLYLPRHPYTRFLVREAGRYRLRAEWRQGRLLVNGEPVHGALPTLDPG